VAAQIVGVPGPVLEVMVMVLLGLAANSEAAWGIVGVPAPVPEAMVMALLGLAADLEVARGIVGVLAPVLEAAVMVEAVGQCWNCRISSFCWHAP